MTDWYDKEQLYCINCHHKWVLISNKEITDTQHNIWVKAVMEQHAQIQKEKEED